MALRSSALANTYLLPQQQQQAPAPRPQFQDEIGAPEEGLQQIDGTTSQYFDKWAALKGFARDVWENYGIDVRFPDPSVPESNRLNRIYLKSIADLKSQGAKLKTSQSMYNAALQRGDIIRKDPRQGYFSDFQPGTDVVHKPLDPIVTEANNKLQQQYYDAKSLGEAKQIYETTKAKLLQNAETDQGNQEYWLRQIDALTPPTSATRQFAERADPTKKDINKINAGGAFLKKVESLRNGTADSYKLSDSVFGPNGERGYVSTDMAGDTYAGKEVVRHEFFPELNKSYLVLRGKTVNKDGEREISKIDWSTSDPMSSAKGFVTENPRYATAGEFIDIYADQHGMFKETTGEVDPSSLVTPDIMQRRAKMMKEISGDSGQAFKLKKLGDELASLKHSGEKGILDWTDDRTEKIGSDGVPIKIRKSKEGYEIENIRSMFPGKTPAFYKRHKSMGKQALVNFLVKRGVLDAEEEAPSPVAEQAPVEQSGTQVAPEQTETEAQRILREYRAKQAQR